MFNPIQVLLAGFYLIRKLIQLSPLKEYLYNPVVPNLPREKFLEASDSELISHIRQQAETIYHPMSTCAIGRVTDEKLRVKGIQGLRVCDASVFPESVSGHPVCSLYSHFSLSTPETYAMSFLSDRSLPSLLLRRSFQTCSRLRSRLNRVLVSPSLSVKTFQLRVTTSTSTNSWSLPALSSRNRLFWVNSSFLLVTSACLLSLSYNAKLNYFGNVLRVLHTATACSASCGSRRRVSRKGHDFRNLNSAS